jgi:hypothetical protein
MGFGDSVRASANKMKQQLNDKATEIAVELYEKTVELTPVGSPTNKKHGELKNNWFVGIGSVNKSYTPNFDDNGTASLFRIYSIRKSNAFLGKDNVVTLTNTVDYGFRAEYAGWPSPKWNNTLPYAMMRNALTIVSTKYKR